LVVCSEVEGGDVIIGVLHRLFLITYARLLLLAGNRDILSYNRLLLLTRNLLWFCPRVLHLPLLAENGRHSWHVILAILYTFPPSGFAKLFCLAPQQLIEASTILPLFGKVSSYWSLIRKTGDFYLFWLLSLSLYAQNLTKFFLILGFSEKLINVISHCINIEKLGVAHPRRVDGRVVLQVVVLTKLLKTMLLWRTQHLLSHHPLPLEAFFIIPSPHLSSFCTPSNLDISFTVTVDLSFALFLLRLRVTEGVCFLFGSWRSRLRGRAKRKLLVGDKGILFRLWVWLHAIVFVGVTICEGFLWPFDRSNWLGGTLLWLLFILLAQGIDHLREDVAVRQEWVIHIFKYCEFTLEKASLKVDLRSTVIISNELPVLEGLAELPVKEQVDGHHREQSEDSQSDHLRRHQLG
jgi:hypothetical protein